MQDRSAQWNLTEQGSVLELLQITVTAIGGRSAQRARAWRRIKCGATCELPNSRGVVLDHQHAWHIDGSTPRRSTCRSGTAMSSAARHRRSQPQRRADWNHRRPSRMHGLDDLAAVDALQVDGGDAEVAVAELALDDDQRHAFAGHLDRVGVAKLVRREAAPNPCHGSRPSQLRAGRGGRPVAAARRAVDDAQQGTNRKLGPHVEPGLELLPSPGIHADLAATPALAAPDQDRPATLIQIALGQTERFLDTPPRAPQDNDQRA